MKIWSETRFEKWALLRSEVTWKELAREVRVTSSTVLKWAGRLSGRDGKPNKRSLRKMQAAGWPMKAFFKYSKHSLTPDVTQPELPLDTQTGIEQMKEDHQKQLDVLLKTNQVQVKPGKSGISLQQTVHPECPKPFKHFDGLTNMLERSASYPDEVRKEEIPTLIRVYDSMIEIESDGKIITISR